jgi:hypothetical protein
MEFKSKSVVVSQCDLLARINRALLEDYENEKVLLEATRPGTRNRRELGEYYLVNDDIIVECDVDAEHFARNLGVLKPFEWLALTGLSHCLGRWC